MNSDNPFSVVTPEELTAEQADQLFVEKFFDYQDITSSGNTLVLGARGCGKSMLIRCSMPDFLMVRKGLKFSELPYFSFYVSVKKTDLNLADLQKINNVHVPYLINEHFLTLHVIGYALLGLSKIEYENSKFNRDEYQRFFEKTYTRYMKLAGCDDEICVNYSSPNGFFDSLYQHIVDMISQFILFISRLPNGEINEYVYDLPVLSFSRFIVPVFSELKTITGFPNDKPILLFIDDADNLSEIQTKIINTWIARRSQPTISLKVFSQIGLYKTFLTSTGTLIESPHDYQALNISSRYTTKGGVERSDQYFEKATTVLIKRMLLYGCVKDIDPENRGAVERAVDVFFPKYQKQEDEIKKEIERIKQRYAKEGRGNRESDDIRRYAVPNYIRKLSGASKSKSTFRYAGIESIVHLSSGIIRYLLDAAAKMYDATLKRNDIQSAADVTCIPSDIQNEVLRDKADYYLFSELPRSKESTLESAIAITDNPRNITEKLANLINAMGKTFQEILLSGDDDNPFSGRSERMVFSIALSNPEKVPDELQDVFGLGVRLGFLHESYIGNKKGNGRTILYILNRCFAPIFTLAPSGFQGYLFMTNDDLMKAIHSGKCLRVIEEASSDDDLRQLSIFDFWED